MVAQRDLAAEMADPKYAYIERERRWLVDQAHCPALDPLSAVRIEDNYILGSRFRLRRMTSADGMKVALKLTRKYEANDPARRPVVTAYLTEGEYDLFAGLPAHRLAKTRYGIAVDGIEWSIDRFGDPFAGLLIAEIEADDDDALDSVVAPEWALREITHNLEFQGGSLAAQIRKPED